ncbi:uncharacterized protein LOC128883848 isoform X2 [Hylaeus volcanicus]|uniref:uncharacterized protein LOC128883848 isoform X2 n=1 Tax=Hylaeus volcanicus TaxID=313075 RepID=UPI0023B7B224|nr:uncharacterized protein LOC128883848 isoform X2 [Hylaeus volcanicus]
MFKSSRNAMSTFPLGTRLLAGKRWNTRSPINNRSYVLKNFTFHKMLSLYNQQSRSKSSFSEYILTQIQKEVNSNVEFQKSVNDLYKITSAANYKSIDEAYRVIIAKGQFVKAKLQEGLNNYIKKNDFFRKMSSLTPKMNSALQVIKNFFDQFEEDTPTKAQFKADNWVDNIAKARMREKHETRDRKFNKHGTSPSQITKDLVVVEQANLGKINELFNQSLFLNNFLSESSLNALFGTSEQSAVLKEIQEKDSLFRLPDFLELVEHVIIPHIIKSFFRADRETFRIHSRKEVFIQVDRSFKERELMGILLDPSILCVRNVELRGASRFYENQPSLLFTFIVEQINCIRAKDNSIVQGRADDIREVLYSMGLGLHPDPHIKGLKYPWQVTELVMLRDSPYW